MALLTTAVDFTVAVAVPVDSLFKDSAQAYVNKYRVRDVKLNRTRIELNKARHEDQINLHPFLPYTYDTKTDMKIKSIYTPIFLTLIMGIKYKRQKY